MLPDVEPNIIPNYYYKHESLTTQLSKQGVVQIELDIHWNEERGDIDVYHMAIDPFSTCSTLVSCLQEVKDYQSTRPATQPPLFVYIEPKSLWTAAQLAKVSTIISNLWATEKIITPGMSRSFVLSLLVCCVS